MSASSSNANARRRPSPASGRTDRVLARRRGPSKDRFVHAVSIRGRRVLDAIRGPLDLHGHRRPGREPGSAPAHAFRGRAYHDARLTVLRAEARGERPLEVGERLAADVRVGRGEGGPAAGLLEDTDEARGGDALAQHAGRLRGDGVRLPIERGVLRHPLSGRAEHGEVPAATRQQRERDGGVSRRIVIDTQRPLLERGKPLIEPGRQRRIRPDDLVYERVRDPCAIRARDRRLDEEICARGANGDHVAAGALADPLDRGRLARSRAGEREVQRTDGRQEPRELAGGGRAAGARPGRAGRTHVGRECEGAAEREPDRQALPWGDASGRERATDPVTLSEFAAELRDEVPRRRVLDADGDDRETEIVRDLDERPRVVERRGLSREPSYERAGELELVDASGERTSGHVRGRDTIEGKTRAGR